MEPTSRVKRVVLVPLDSSTSTNTKRSGGPPPGTGAAVAVLATVSAIGYAVVRGVMLPDAEAKPNTAVAASQAPPKTPNKPAGPVNPSPRPTIWNDAQIKNAETIVRVGKQMGMPDRAWVIALATAMQESSLTNHGHLGAKNDHDSLGLFQQRPSQGWGTPAQVQDPVYASRKFYEKLRQIPGWEKMRLTDAAQLVQRSAFPEAYQKHEGNAKALVDYLVSNGRV